VAIIAVALVAAIAADYYLTLARVTDTSWVNDLVHVLAVGLVGLGAAVVGKALNNGKP
jgi:hypothetical protein